MVPRPAASGSFRQKSGDANLTLTLCDGRYYLQSCGLCAPCRCGSCSVVCGHSKPLICDNWTVVLGSVVPGRCPTYACLAVYGALRKLSGCAATRDRTQTKSSGWLQVVTAQPGASSSGSNASQGLPSGDRNNYRLVAAEGGCVGPQEVGRSQPRLLLE